MSKGARGSPTLNRKLLKIAHKTQQVPIKGKRGAFQTVPLDEDEVFAEIAQLIKRGADPNAADETGCTALMSASRHGQTTVVLLLLEAGALVNQRNKDGSTALYYAVIGIDPSQVVSLLLKRGADPNIPGYEGRSPLFYALRRELAVVEKLVEKGAEVNVKAADGATPLHWAVKMRRLDAIKFLLSRGANINAPNDLGVTPLGTAAKELTYTNRPDRVTERKEFTEIIDFLRRTGAVLTSDPASFQKERLAEKERKSHQRWGPDTPIPDFSKAAKSPSIVLAMRELSKRLGSKAVPLPSTFARVPGAISFEIAPSSVDVEKLQIEFVARKCLVFGSQAPMSIECIVVLPTLDRYKAIAAMQTNAANYGMGTGAIIEWTKNLEKSFPYVLTGIGLDFLEGRFLRPIDEPRALAKEMVEFCPDIGSVREAVKLIKKQRFYFWWD